MVRGAEDDVAGPVGMVRDEQSSPLRPPGGKPLLRLVHLLESQGLEEIADRVVAETVAAELRSRTFEAAAQYGLTATAESTTATRPGRKTSRTRRAPVSASR